MRIRALLLTLPVLAATGCGISSTTSSITQPETSSGMVGKMYGGQQPIVGAKVSVYAMSTGSYGGTATLLGTPVLTDNNGGFSYGPYTCPANNPPVYILGQGGNAGAGVNNAIALTSGIGNCNTASSVYANINEVTTAATAFALSHFFNTQLGTGADNFGGTATPAEGNNAGLVQANLYTIPLLVSLPNGTANANTATVTLESAKLNSIANTLAACVNSASGGSTNCQSLFNNTTITTTSGSSVPSDTLQAAVRMALYPSLNVANLYNLAPPSSPFAGLPAAPNDWTLAVAYTSPNFGLSIAGTATSGTSSTIDIDATGRVWFPSNTTAAHGVAYFDPSTSKFSTIYGTVAKSPQYLAIDTEPQNVVWASDMQGNEVVGTYTTSPTVAGNVAYYTQSATSTGPVTISNNASTPNGVLFAGQTSSGPAFFEFDSKNGTPALQSTFTTMPTGMSAFTYNSPAGYFEVEAATSGANTACNLESSYLYAAYPPASDQIYATTGSPCISGGSAQMLQGTYEALTMATTANMICSENKGTCFTAPVTLNLPEGVALDGDANVWVANSGNGSIGTFAFSGSSTYTATSTVPYVHSALMPKPYGIAVDRSGNVWVSNAGCVNNSATACTPGSFVLSELIGAGAPTLTPLSAQSGVTPMGGSRPAATPVVRQQQSTSVRQHGTN